MILHDESLVTWAKSGPHHEWIQHSVVVKKMAIAVLKFAIEIVDLPMKHGDFNSCLCKRLPFAGSFANLLAIGLVSGPSFVLFFQFISHDFTQVTHWKRLQWISGGIPTVAGKIQTTPRK